VEIHVRMEILGRQRSANRIVELFVEHALNKLHRVAVRDAEVTDVLDRHGEHSLIGREELLEAGHFGDKYFLQDFGLGP
jgi:hypothetical protein